ncbi:hopanoid biosynthesis-associated protein HpnK [Phenylobacterium sp.]|uniref:hopanoid biosynthesis-associated protein HpnK n=1 Tax=Phenylobacterium sp. TaxID=1871053 RepID=UPI001213B431|nr:hopanoid biosynthesis-associated protein HpnK [Phenylobacterium sp.]THD61324.1 MAG: ChbG/HpnK family deacetylase [Phenylobacterium sp.]
MRRLIVTADDFGAAAEVNEAVEIGHRDGVLTSASLMVAARGCADAVARARRLPKLRVGLHLVLVEGRPKLPANELPDLVTRDGLFRTDMAVMGAEIFFRPKVRRQLAAEIEAQFAAFAATGLPLDHANTHKHYHLHPTIAGLMLSIGARYGLRASRAPIEPRAILAAVDPAAAPRPAYVTEPWARQVRARYRRAGITVADQVFGLAWSGTMTTDRVAGILRRLPPGLSELYLHPATSGGFEGAVAGYDYAGELAALTAAQTRQALAGSGAEHGGFSDFV